MQSLRRDIPGCSMTTLSIWQTIKCKRNMSLYGTPIWTVIFAESRRLLVGVLLSENHKTCRELGAQCLQQVSLLSSVAHQWVLLLLSDSMAEAESKPRFCSEYFQQFARAMQALPQQSQAVSAVPHSGAGYGTVQASGTLKCPDSQSRFEV